MTYSSSVQNTKPIHNTRPITIVIVNDKKAVIAKLQEILSKHTVLQIIGTANNEDQALTKIELLKPDVVLMGAEMPTMDGIKAIQIIRQKFPESKVLILSIHEKEEYIKQIINAGANGFIPKNIAIADLVNAIHQVSQDYLYFDPKILEKARQQNDIQNTDLIPDKVNSQKQLHLKNKPKIIKPNDANIATNLSTAKLEEFLPPIGKWLRWGGISVVTVVALVIPTSSILKYKTTVKTQAMVRPQGEVRLVQAAVEGQIADILVKQGETVNKGEVIATIDRSRFQTKKNQLESAIAQQKLQLNQIKAQIASLESQKIAETERNYSEILAAKAELAGNRRNYQEKNVEADTNVEQAQSKLKAAQATLKAAIAKQNRYSAVAKAGAIGKDRFAEVELEVKQRQQEIKAAKANLQRSLAGLKPSTAEIEMAQERIEQVKKSGQAAIAGLNQQKEALMQQLTELNKQLEQDTQELRQIKFDLGKTDIIATAVGTISELKLRNPGQTVQSGQEIAQIVPSNASLEIKAMVSPQDIGKLKTNQKVQMRISACPYPDYGTLNGTVSQIAKDISQVQSNSTNNSLTAQPAPAYFEVSILPKNPSFGRGKHICSLQSGMEGTADIITKEETVLQFLLRKARLISNF